MRPRFWLVSMQEAQRECHMNAIITVGITVRCWWNATKAVVVICSAVWQEVLTETAVIYSWAQSIGSYKTINTDQSSVAQCIIHVGFLGALSMKSHNLFLNSTLYLWLLSSVNSQQWTNDSGWNISHTVGPCVIKLPASFCRQDSSWITFSLAFPRAC